MAPEDMAAIVGKATANGEGGVLVAERGTAFGYHRLIVDMRGLAAMRSKTVLAAAAASWNVTRLRFGACFVVALDAFGFFMPWFLCLLLRVCFVGLSGLFQAAQRTRRALGQSDAAVSSSSNRIRPVFTSHLLSILFKSTLDTTLSTDPARVRKRSSSGCVIAV